MDAVSLATVIDGEALWKTVAAALVAGVGVTLIFSLGIRGATRFAEANRDGRTLAAGAYATLMALSAITTTAVIVVALLVMTSK